MGWNTMQQAEKTFKASDYWKEPEKIVHKAGLKILIFGEPEVGKVDSLGNRDFSASIGIYIPDEFTLITHFALTFPEPVYVVDTEFGTSPLLRHEEFKNKDIKIFEACVLDSETVEVDPIKSIEKLEEAIGALKTLEKGTVVIDSVSDIWQWLLTWLEVAATRKTQSGQVYRFEYGKANQRYRKLILRLLAQPINVVLTSHVGEVYDSSGQSTGAKIPKTQKSTMHMVDLGLYSFKRYDAVAKTWKYTSTVTKCRFKRSFEAEIDDITYPRLVQFLKEKLGVVIS